MLPTSQIQAFVTKLNQVDFGPIAFQLLHHPQGPQWNSAQVQTAILEYKEFLFQHFLHPDRTLEPNKTVDEVWHRHILDTQKYFDDCMHLFGHLVHHYPYPTP
jgi:hypothetical protein